MSETLSRRHLLKHTGLATAWTALAGLLASLIAYLALFLLFFCIVTPIGLLGRLFGKDFLNERFDREKESYWIPRKRVDFKKEDYEKQF